MFGCTMADVLPLSQNSSLIFQVKLQPDGELNSIVKQGLYIYLYYDGYIFTISLSAKKANRLRVFPKILNSSYDTHQYKRRMSMDSSEGIQHPNSKLLSFFFGGFISGGNLSIKAEMLTKSGQPRAVVSFRPPQK